VRENISRIESGDKTPFCKLGTTNGLATITLYEVADCATNLISTSTVYAVISTNGSRFTIVSANGDCNGSFELPTYRSASGKLKLILLTPVAVVLDVSIVEESWIHLPKCFCCQRRECHMAMKGSDDCDHD